MKKEIKRQKINKSSFNFIKLNSTPAMFSDQIETKYFKLKVMNEALVLDAK